MTIDDAERRSEERSDCAIVAKIELSDRLAIAVTICDISVNGVRLEVHEGIQLPDEFDLLVPVVGDVEQRHRIRVAWRRAGALGGEFVVPDRSGAGLSAMDTAIENDRRRR